MNIRLMKADDFDAVVDIDKKVLNVSRLEYYEMKFDKLFQSREFVPTSLVAETEAGDVVGFVMGELYIGEYGISRDSATIDTIGVDPRYRKQGVGKLLMNEFIEHLRDLGVNRLATLVDKNDSDLIKFFQANQFDPSKGMVSLERSI